METYFFKVSGGNPHYNGKHILDAHATTIYMGYLVEISSGEVIVDTGVGNACGMLYEFRPLAEYPTSENVGATEGGNYVNFVTGDFTAFINVGLFAAGSMPSVGNSLYAGTSGSVGKLATSGSTTVLGKVEALTTLVDEYGTSYSVALCHMHFEL